MSIYPDQCPRPQSRVHTQPLHSTPRTPSSVRPVVMVGSPHSRSEIAAWNTSSYGHNSLAAPREIYYQDGPSQSIQNSPKTNRHAPPALSSEPPKQVISRELPVDYRMLLLALADQYISAARSLSIQIAYQQSGREQYQKLMATGLGCMEQVLKKVWRGCA